MSNGQKPENEYMDRQQEQIFFMSICENINQLSKLKYAELRNWILLRPTKADWEALMSS